MELPIGKSSLERLTHYNCGRCAKWWSIGDVPAERDIWFCPWCGCKQRITTREDPDENLTSTPSSR